MDYNFYLANCYIQDKKVKLQVINIMKEFGWSVPKNLDLYSVLILRNNTKGVTGDNRRNTGFFGEEVNLEKFISLIVNFEPRSPIVIGDYEVNFQTNGDIVVGCQFVTREQILKIKEQSDKYV